MSSHSDFVVFDLETTGLDPLRQEIIEIGAVRVSSDLNLEEGEFHAKIIPQHIETALPEALLVNGYSVEQWKDAKPITEVIPAFLHFIQGSILAAYNNTLDMRFLLAYVEAQKHEMTADYHYVDIFSIAYEYLLKSGASEAQLKLSDMCAYFKVPKPPQPHQALDDARAALAVWRMIRAGI